LNALYALYSKVPEYIHEGLQTAPEAFVNMMTSKNQDLVGKQIVKIEPK